MGKVASAMFCSKKMFKKSCNFLGWRFIAPIQYVTVSEKVHGNKGSKISIQWWCLSDTTRLDERDIYQKYLTPRKDLEIVKKDFTW